MRRQFTTSRPAAGAKRAVAKRSVKAASRSVGASRGVGASQVISNCLSCDSCGCETVGQTSSECCAPCSCRPVKGIRSFRQGIVMTGGGCPAGSCGFDPSIVCANLPVGVDPVEGKTDDGTFFRYRSIQLAPTETGYEVLDDPIGYGPTVNPEDDGYAAATPVYPAALRGAVNFLYESWIDPVNCTWWRLRYDSCGRPLGYEAKVYDSNEDLEMALRELRGFNSDTNNNAAAEACTSFVVAGVPSTVNIETIGLSPPFIVTGPDFGYQVFILDTSNGRYYRDPNNVQCTLPFVFSNPSGHTCCDGATFTQYYFSGPNKAPGDVIEDQAELDLVNSICYEFSSATCRWYVCGVQDGADLPIEPVELKILQCCWSGCRNKIGVNADCPDAIDKPSLCCASCCP